MLNHSAVRQILWLVLAVAALVATWSQILGYLAMPFLDAQVQFWKDTLLHPASRFITLDILFLCTPVMTWMLMEARRLGIRWPWAYIVFGIVIAISSAFPLFMYARERKLVARSEDTSGLTALDQLGIAVLASSLVGYVVLAART